MEVGCHPLSSDRKASAKQGGSFTAFLSLCLISMFLLSLGLVTLKKRNLSSAKSRDWAKL